MSDTNEVKLGATVKWSRGRKELGEVVHFFTHNDRRFAVVEQRGGNLIVCRISEDLQVVKK